MNARTATPLLGFALAAAAGFAAAQTTTTPDPAPAKVGVTQGTAVDAEQKAVPRSDTATLVRTNKASRNSAATSTGAQGGTTDTTAMANGRATDATNASTTDDAIDHAPPTAAGTRARHARN